jgi:hypothetical protein
VIDRPLSEAFVAIVDWATSLGAINIKLLPGCWEHDLDDFHFAINGHAEEIVCSTGMDVEPFGALVTRNGWPFAFLNAYHGIIVAESPDDAEGFLIDALRKNTPPND